MEISSVNPVFLKRKDIPRSDVERVTVLEICLSGERVSGQGTVVGAQEIHGLWRIYPTTTAARNELLIRGLKLRNVTVKVCADNPFSLRDGAGNEKPSTKVFIGNVPISVADSEIEHSLVSLGCELRSDVKQQRARDTDGKLTRFLTGSRFVFITLPPSPLEKTMKVSFFTASVYHKEQKNTQRKVYCSRCLTEGHHVSQCLSDVVCRQCHKSGHKRGSPECPAFSDSDNRPKEADKDSALSKQNVGPDAPANCATGLVNRPTPSADSFVRPTARQTTLHDSVAQRSRSESTKRRRSGDRDNRDGLNKQDKLQKRGDSSVAAGPANQSDADHGVG